MDGGCVVAVAGLRGEIDPADERDAVVDHDRLLVVAVQRPFLRIERALDLRVRDQLVSHLSHVVPGGPEERQRRTGPRQHAYVDALRELCEQVPKDDELAVALEREVRREMPAGQMNVRACLAELLRDRGQRLGAVDQNLDGIPGPDRGITGRPAAARGLERARPADPPQTALVMAADLLGDLIAEPTLDRKQKPPNRRAWAALRSCGSGRR